MIDDPKNPSNGGLDEDHQDAPYENKKGRKVVIQPYDYPVRTLMDMIVDGELKLNPDYQRKYRWDDIKASRFIESLVLNIPVPVVYLAEEPDNTFTVIDGQQRLTSLFRFLKPSELGHVFPETGLEKLILSDLKVRDDMNEKHYLELDQTDKSSIAKRPIRCIAVLNESDSMLKFEVFERLNSGSASLTDQEVRNCTYNGRLNDLLKELAENEHFISMTRLSEQKVLQMKRPELVLRFFAYKEMTEETEYCGSYVEHLNQYMEENRHISEGKADEMRQLFNATIDLIFDSLGEGVAFRKPASDNLQDGFAQNLINGAIYESQMIAFSRLVDCEKKAPVNVKEVIHGAFLGEYSNHIYQGTAKKNKVIARSKILTEALLNAL